MDHIRKVQVSSEHSSRQQAAIFIVEDDSVAAGELESRLTALGYHVAGTARDAEAALRLVNEGQAELVLMDIHLGAGMEGINAARLMRAESDVPVVFMTGRPDTTILQRAKTADPFGFIVKPFTDHDLQSAIEMALYRHGVDVRVREKERWLAATLGSIGEGVIATDAQGRVLLLNSLAEALTGRARGDVLGADLDQLLHLVDTRSRERIPNLALDALSQGTVMTVKDVTLEGVAGGEDRHIEAAVAPIRDVWGRVSGAVVAFRDVTERRRLENERDVYRKELERANVRLLQQASTDQLTQLRNRRAFQDRLWKELSRVKRTGGALSLLMIDVDRFKQFNDAFGHPAGDVVLRDVARLLEKTARDMDTVARYGGEEFVVLLPDTDEAGGLAVAERMRAAVADGNWPHRAVTISVGVATCRGEAASDGAGLIARADKALYFSKESGRNRVTHGQSLVSELTVAAS